MPKRVLRAVAGLYPNEAAIEELVVLMAAADYRRANLRQEPSLEFLAFTAGLSMETFAAALERLSKKGLVKRKTIDDEHLQLDHDELYKQIRAIAPEGE